MVVSKTRLHVLLFFIPLCAATLKLETAEPTAEDLCFDINNGIFLLSKTLNYYYDTPSSVESLIAPGLLEQFETISEMELLSSALLSRPNSSIPERNVHRLIGTMMKTIVRLSCKWLNNNEDFSWYPIDCDEDAELAILGTYFKIAKRLPNLNTFFVNKPVCGPYNITASSWWQKYEADYYPEIYSFYNLIKTDRHFNITLS